MRTNIKHKPWTDKFGHTLPDSELKEVSKNWNLKDWEAFQKHGMGTSSWVGDFLGNARDIEKKFSHDKSVWDFCGGEISKSLKSKIPDLKRCLGMLSIKERKTLKHYFFDSMTDQQVARLNGESCETVKARRKRAIKKLKSLFLKENDSVDEVS